MSWDDKVAATWRQHGMPAPTSGGATAVKDGYRFKLVGRALIVSNAKVLVSEASHRAETEPAPAREEPVKGQFDGEHVAQSLEDRAGRAPTPQAGIALRTFAALSAVMKTATLGSVVSQDGSEVVIESLLSPTVEGASGGALVEEWQQESRVRNTLHLPKAVGEAAADRPIRFLMEVEQDQQMRRAFPVTARQKVEQVAPGRWRVSVAPGPSLADPVPPSALSAADRRRYTDGGGIAPRIRSAADEIVADKTSAKEAARLIVVWMKRNMTYELTPRELRDEAILERRRGDCSEYSKPTVALLRAKGIPARVRSGFLADGGDLVAHAWVEFFDGTGSREIDPTVGASSVDARHVDASLVDAMSLVLLAQIRWPGSNDDPLTLPGAKPLLPCVRSDPTRPGMRGLTLFSPSRLRRLPMRSVVRSQIQVLLPALVMTAGGACTGKVGGGVSPSGTGTGSGGSVTGTGTGTGGSTGSGTAGAGGDRSRVVPDDGHHADAAAPADQVRVRQLGALPARASIPAPRTTCPPTR